MIIGVISDTHDQIQMTRKAIDFFNEKTVDAVIHCGDFVAPFTIKLFSLLKCPFYGVFGNNDGEKPGLLKAASEFKGVLVEPPHIFQLGEKKILVNHAPVSENLLKKQQETPDYILWGHLHEIQKTQVDGIPGYNPGEACGWLSGKATVALLNTETGEFQIHTI